MHSSANTFGKCFRFGKLKELILNKKSTQANDNEFKMKTVEISIESDNEPEVMTNTRRSDSILSYNPSSSSFSSASLSSLNSNNNANYDLINNVTTCNCNNKTISSQIEKCNCSKIKNDYEYIQSLLELVNAGEISLNSDEIESECNKFVQSILMSNSTINKSMNASTKLSFSSESNINIEISMPKSTSTSFSSTTSSCSLDYVETDNYYQEEDEEDDLNVEINNCVSLINQLNFIKSSLGSENLIGCITSYEPIFEDDLKVEFADTCLILLNETSQESDEWLCVQSIRTGQKGFIPKYLAMDLDVFVEQCKNHYYKLLKMRKKRRNMSKNIFRNVC